jgi:hypothetical protein
MENNTTYTRLIFLKTLPLWLFSFLLVFFAVYQIAIGNAFLEDIHPGVIFTVFSVVLITFSLCSSIFLVKIKNSAIHIRLGYYKRDIPWEKIQSISFHENYKNKDITYGVSFGKENEVFIKIDNVAPLEITTKDGEKILIFEKNAEKIHKDISSTC